MKKHINYYANKVSHYRKCGESARLLKGYYYFQERYYYYAIADSIEYSEFNIIYNYIFKYIKNNMDDLDINTIEGIFAYTLFLLDLGYLASDKDMPYFSCNLGLNELPILPNFTMNRHSKCRHNTALLRDLIVSRNHKAYILAGVSQDLNEILSHKAINKERANHSITVAEDSEFSYMLDPSKKEIFSLICDDEILSNKLSKFTLCEGKFVSHNEQIFYELNVTKPFKNPNEIRKETQKYIDYLSNNLNAFEEMHEKILPALKDAEKVYQRIIAKRVI